MECALDDLGNHILKLHAVHTQSSAATDRAYYTGQMHEPGSK